MGDALIRVAGLVIVAGLAGSCLGEDLSTVRRGSAAGAQRGDALQGIGARGMARYARRVDGDITSITRPWSDDPESPTVVTTGAGSGADQSSVLLFSPDGLLTARYRVSGDVRNATSSSSSPYRFLTPNAPSLVAYTHVGTSDDGTEYERRLLLFATYGMFVPYSLEIVEVVDDTLLEPRFRFWNPGGISRPVVAEGVIAFHAVDNNLADTDALEYTEVVVTLSIDEILAGAGRDTVDFGYPPTAGDNGRGYALHLAIPGPSSPEMTVAQTFDLRDGLLRFGRERGIIYVLDVTDGTLSAERSAGGAGWAAVLEPVPSVDVRRPGTH